MPVFNASLYLEECLDSILGQTMTDWELIAVDDFSTDASLDILRKYAYEDSRIRVLSNNEKGITPALIKGYCESKGGYITRMDADDVMVDTKLADLYAGLQDTINSVAVGKVKYFAENGVRRGYLRYEHWLNHMVMTNSHFSEIYKECVIPSPCWMMSRELFDKIGGFQAATYPEDYDLVFRMYEQWMEVVGVMKVLHLWRDHEDRASRNDPNYRDQSFMALKMKYFLKLDYVPQVQLGLWGAGAAGKTVARALREANVSFKWYTNNPKKIDKEIYGIVLRESTELNHIKNTHLITAVRTRDFQETEHDTLVNLEEHDNLTIHFY